MNAAKRACKASRVEHANERANGQVSGPVLTSVLLVILDHSVAETNLRQCTAVPEVNRISMNET